MVFHVSPVNGNAEVRESAEKVLEGRSRWSLEQPASCRGIAVALGEAGCAVYAPAAVLGSIHGDVPPTHPAKT